jgi:hypothetical protein
MPRLKVRRAVATDAKELLMTFHAEDAMTVTLKNTLLIIKFPLDRRNDRDRRDGNFLKCAIVINF